ncbi:TatD family hydrolase [Thiomicrorhabdus sp. zzn3]|uniref:TatD family hydrolase n=1 Tax=Thiomicrorhabdus sp. zzn3 TaxID=3039775 RepID=UPI002436EF55|nr:TatD family hydrolase [Thiomicrorhabdus sp. zzn3]MDG6779168.1 TatD family hydrolase [Thiomicrorhabdus sp. zzn3]
MLVDTHCHLDQIDPNDLKTSLSADCVYLSMGTDKNNWQQLLRLNEKYSNIRIALGIHPWFVSDHSVDDLHFLYSLLSQIKVHAIGEIGLDFGLNHKASRDLQLEVFEAQLKLAHELALPISVHVYKAHNEVIALLKRYDVQGVIHSLGSSVNIAQQYVDLGFKFGVNGILLRENARRYHALVEHFDIRHIVSETDAPNIALPGRSKGHLKDIVVIIERIASLKKLTVAEAQRCLFNNANSVFKFIEECEV